MPSSAAGLVTDKPMITTETALLHTMKTVLIKMPGITPTYVTMSCSLMAFQITPTRMVSVSTMTRDQSIVMVLHGQMIIWKLLLAIKPTPCSSLVCTTTCTLVVMLVTSQAHLCVVVLNT
jgi:hypothetical protein